MPARISRAALRVALGVLDVAERVRELGGGDQPAVAPPRR